MLPGILMSAGETLILPQEYTVSVLSSMFSQCLYSALQARILGDRYRIKLQPAAMEIAILLAAKAI